MVSVEIPEVWQGDLTAPEDQDTIQLSQKEMAQNPDVEKVNFTVKYDVTDLNYAANASIAIVFDKKTVVYQTNLKGVQGEASASFRLPFLPKYANQKKRGKHLLDIVVKIRPQWSVWHFADNYQDFQKLVAVAEGSTSRYVEIGE
ncbi:MAG: hypothetical protein PHT59_06585 [Candidatus Omnitrophica bacterium]|nr:hypothetical protein [Candidatus Omnitrophota bacterium]